MNPSSASKNTATIIVSNEGLPDSKMGSWTQRIDYLLSQYPENKIDYLLCGAVDAPFQSSGNTTRIICNSWKTEINRKWFYTFKFGAYIKALKAIIAKHDFVVIVVMDNTKLKNIVTDTIAQNGWQNKCRVIFVQCGFSYEFTRREYRDFRKGLHEVVLLTQKSYTYERNKYHEYPFLVNVLHNPVKQNVFYQLPSAQRAEQRKEIGIEPEEKIFLWIAHDRPKKGLDIILRMWPEVKAKYPDSKLIVVGAKREIVLPGLRFEGKLPNTELAKYYQSADVFLFSSLCQEGFGLSLAEAMSCGCFCIASDVGGVDEFFGSSNGILVQHPNLPEAWVEAINQYYTQPEPMAVQSQLSLLSYDEWCGHFQQIISSSIEFLIQSANR